MTNQESIVWIKSIKDIYIHGGDDDFDEKRKESLDMAIKALEQEQSGKKTYKSEARRWKMRYLDLKKRTIKLEEQQPCEDCISRESVIEWLKDKDIIKTKNQEENARRELTELPSVTPQPKIEVSEDCISREAVIQIIDNKLNPCTDMFKCLEMSEIKEDVKFLPSVQPQRKKEKWIHWTDDFKDYVTCSCCDYGEEGEVLLEDKTPFCPICGADMRGDDNGE